MKVLYVTLLFFLTLTANAQSPFEGNFKNEELNIRLKINLYEANIPQLQFDDETCYGYMQGSINGSWVILKIINIDDDTAEVRAVSDSGVDAQTLLIVAKEGNIEIKQMKDTNIRGVKNGKYTKLPKVIILKRQ